MALYRYKKVDSDYYRKKQFLDLTEEKKKQPNVWSGIGSSYSFLQALTNSSRLANIVIPFLFVSVGFFFIYQYFFPSIQSYFRETSGVIDQGTTAAVSDSFIARDQFVSNPSGLIENSSIIATQAAGQVQDLLSQTYGSTFYLSIPSLGIDRLPVQPNVDSVNKEVYNEVLKNSLAHFENTGLPISDVARNIVIYGHSAVSSYNPQPNDPEVAFSFLPNLKVGDEIYIDIDGERHAYRMFRSKIVEPSDVSVIQGTPDREMLTLFSCYPPGNVANRIVITARPV